MKHLYIYFLIFLLSVAGCGKKAGDYHKDSKNIGQGEIKLPSDYPQAFINTNDGTILSVNITQEGTEVMFRSESNGQSIIERYRIAAAETGYKEQITDKTGKENNEVTFFNEKENKRVSVTVTPSSGGKTLITFKYK